MEFQDVNNEKLVYDDISKVPYDLENKPLRSCLKYILNNYDNLRKNININNHDDQYEKSFSNFIYNTYPNKFLLPLIEKFDLQKKFLSKGSKHGGTHIATTPFLAIKYEENRKTGEPSVSKGYAVVYLFRSDMKGVYLTFDVGTSDLKSFDMEGFRQDIQNSCSIVEDDDFSTENIDLVSDFKYGSGYSSNNAKQYQKGMIFNKFYQYGDGSDLPDEEELINDLKKYLRVYEDSINKCDFNNYKKKVNSKNEGKNMKFRNFYEYLKYNGFYFNQDIVKNFLLSLKVKPFLILTGNSGTGKTQLAKLFAEYKLSKFNTSDENYKLIPVGANWTETRHILGFYNVISKKYVSTPALNLIINAKGNMSNPYFLVLDEMNLSHVERYFSDFLSSIESKKEMPLHNCNKGVVDENEQTIEKELSIPENLFIIGTVNIDETTYMFSPKVLDRANIIEFSTFSNDSGELTIKKYMEDSFEYGQISDDACNFLEDPLSNLELMDINITKLKESFDNDGIWDELSEELTHFHNALSNSNFEFGFRTVNEILAFMYVSKEYESKLGNRGFDNWKIYFDAQIKQKILPKLHGSEILLDTLNKLADCCLDEENKVKYQSSKIKIDEMIRILKKQKYVSFIN